MGIVDLTLQAIIERNIIEQNNEEFEELLIFYHFTQHDLNSFLDLYRFNKIETISLKAVVHHTTISGN